MNTDNKQAETKQCTIPSVMCSVCEGQGWTIEIEANCCGNYREYGCCGVPEPIQVQVECKCDKGCVPNCTYQQYINIHDGVRILIVHIITVHVIDYGIW